MLSMEKRHFTIEEAAAHLGITPKEMTELRNGGEIRGIPERGKWKFDVDDVAELLRSRAARTAPLSVEHDVSAESAGAVLDAGSAPRVGESLEPVPDVNQLRRELLARSSPITSRLIIEYLSSACRVTRDDAESVLDGFWNQAIDMTHYKDGRWLVIPHFGTFSLSRRGDQTALAFMSGPIDSIRRRLQQRRRITASERWIDYFQRGGNGDATGLSVKRRMAVRIAGETGRDLRLVHRVLWELLDVVCEVFASGDIRIRWAMRGEMAPVVWRDETRYRFRCYQRLSGRLLNWAETQQITGRKASGTTEKKDGKPASRRTGRSRATRARQTKDTGCLVSALFIIVVFVEMLIVAI